MSVTWLRAWGMAPAARAAMLAILPLVASGAGACRAMDPPARPEATCARACEVKAPQCNRDACLRGCTLALDKILEREGDAVVACVGKAKACDDPVWARCAVHTGAHADGGPPAPPPAKDYEAEDDTPAAPKKDDDNDLGD